MMNPFVRRRNHFILPASGSAAPLGVFLRYDRRDFCFVRLLCDVASPRRFRLPRATRGAKEVHMREVDLRFSTS